MRLLDLADLSRGPGQALLRATVAMGFSEPVARAGLEAETDAWLLPGALEAVRSELQGASGRLPRRVLVIAARTLPASAMRAVLRARILGAKVLIKPATGQADLARALAAADPDVEPRIFRSSDATALDAAIADADAVVVLGSDETVTAVRTRTPPDKAFVGYGHRLSVAWIGSECDERAAAGGLARDLCAWDQAGCLSPQVAWVADPEGFADALADALRAIEPDLPMALPPEAARQVEVAATLGEMSGRTIRTATARLVCLPASAFRPSPGFRTLWLLPAAESALQRLQGVLSCVGLAGAQLAGLPPDVRVCEPGQMQRPPLDWQQDGLANLTPMLVP